MLMRRKEVKTYGTKKAIEGAYAAGQRCLIVEDLVTSGLSVFETVAPLEHEKLIVEDVVVLLDRGQGGRTNVESRGKNLFSVMTLPQVLTVLRGKDLITEAVNQSVLAFLAANQTVVALDEASGQYSAAKTSSSAAPAIDFTFEERAAVAKNAAGKVFYATMLAKKSIAWTVRSCKS